MTQKRKRVYIDSCVFISSIKEDEGENYITAKQLIEKINSKVFPFAPYKFYTSKFTLVELGEAIARKMSQQQAKSIIFDLIYPKRKRIFFLDPSKPDKKIQQKKYFDIDKLIRQLTHTAIEYCLPAFDTIHCHTIIMSDIDIIITNDEHFKKFQKIKIEGKEIEILTPKEFLNLECK